jgi:low temperature requirement protein LtrA
VWWAWSAFVWASNAEPEDSLGLRLYLLPATLFIFIAGLALPQAFSGRGMLFAVSYAIVRFLHLALYVDASRRGHASWRAISGFAVTVVIGMVLLIVGALFHGTTQVLFWAVAAAIDYAGPAWLTRERLRGIQEVAVAHFAERYGLFVIICLGESIVSIGVGARREPLTDALVAAVALGLVITIGLWWTYFERWADAAEASLRMHADPVLAAADAYSYLHLVIVAGIIIFAVGGNAIVHHADYALSDAARLALCGGIAVYLVGHAGFMARMARTLEGGKLLAAAGAIVVYLLGGALVGWALAGVLAVLLAVLCAAETLRDSRIGGGAVRGRNAARMTAARFPTPLVRKPQF